MGDLSWSSNGTFTDVVSNLSRAEVIKIEHPTRGDDTRAWGPPFAKYKAGGKSKALVRGSLWDLLLRAMRSQPKRREAEQERAHISSV
jgi:hypothetical protein